MEKLGTVHSPGVLSPPAFRAPSVGSKDDASQLKELSVSKALYSTPDGSVFVSEISNA